MEKTNIHCWILKTTSGGYIEKDHWNQFLAENVIAVGWANLRINPTAFNNKDEYKAALSKKYSGDNSHAANTIYDFSRIPSKDIVIVARGYKQDQNKPVHIYGIAQAGNFNFDKDSNWWQFKRKTQIFPLDRYLPKRSMAKIYGIDSCLQTLHGPFPYQVFDRFSKAINLNYKFSKEALICIQAAKTEIISRKNRLSFLDELDTFPLFEGSRRNAVIDAYERNPKARKACLKYHGFRCKVCEMLFSDIYGDAGHEIIQVHHIKPIYKSNRKRVVNPITDLVPVCANCHVIIHTRRPPFSISEVQDIINENKN